MEAGSRHMGWQSVLAPVQRNQGCCLHCLALKSSQDVNHKGGPPKCSFTLDRQWCGTVMLPSKNNRAKKPILKSAVCVHNVSCAMLDRSQRSKTRLM